MSEPASNRPTPVGEAAPAATDRRAKLPWRRPTLVRVPLRQTFLTS